MTGKTVKLTLRDILPVGFTLLVGGIGLAIGIQITGEEAAEIGESYCAENTPPLDGYTYDPVEQNCFNGTNAIEISNSEFSAFTDSGDGLANMTAKMPTLGTVVVAAIIIGVLVTFLFNRVVR